jgi:hypothetical protein
VDSNHLENLGFFLDTVNFNTCCIEIMSSESISKDNNMKEAVDFDVAKVEEGHSYAAIDKPSERSYGKSLPI